MKESLEVVKLSTLEKTIKKIKDELKEEDADLSFEFIIGSFFPNVLNNIKKAFTQNYIQGYNDAKEKYSNES